MLTISFSKNILMPFFLFKQVLLHFLFIYPFEFSELVFYSKFKIFLLVFPVILISLYNKLKIWKKRTCWLSLLRLPNGFWCALVLWRDVRVNPRAEHVIFIKILDCEWKQKRKSFCTTAINCILNFQNLYWFPLFTVTCPVNMIIHFQLTLLKMLKNLMNIFN